MSGTNWTWGEPHDVWGLIAAGGILFITTVLLLKHLPGWAIAALIVATIVDFGVAADLVAHGWNH